MLNYTALEICIYSVRNAFRASTLSSKGSPTLGSAGVYHVQQIRIEAGDLMLPSHGRRGLGNGGNT